MGRWPSGLIDGSCLFAKRQSRLWVERDKRGDGEIRSNLSVRRTLNPCSRQCVFIFNAAREPACFRATERDCDKEYLICQAMRWRCHSVKVPYVRYIPEQHCEDHLAFGRL